MPRRPSPIGADPALVLHGGGNTSVKTTVTDLLGAVIPVLCVKGSGWSPCAPWRSSALQRQLGTITLYVTHDQVEAMTMGHRIAVLHGGRLQQLGTPMELYRWPANVFVAQFIGSPPMNLPAGGGEPVGAGASRSGAGGGGRGNRASGDRSGGLAAV